jgi:hypothetical protein
MASVVPLVISLKSKTDNNPKHKLIAKMYAAYVQNICLINGCTFPSSPRQFNIRGIAKLPVARAICASPAK